MTTSIQPGWYDDPEDSNGQRYWDGQAWTPHRQRKPVSQPSPPPPPASQQAPPPSPSVSPPPQQAPPASAFPPPPLGQQPQWAPPAGGTPQRSRKPLLIVSICVVLAIAGAAVYFLFVMKFVDPDKAAQFVTSQVSQETGNTPTGVKCPDWVGFKEGATFDCHFTLPDGPHTAHVKVTRVNGDDAYFEETTDAGSG